MSLIDDYVDSMMSGLGSMDLTTLEPIDCFDICPLYAKEGVDRVLRIIKKSKFHNKKKLAKKLFTPSAIRIELLLLLIKAKIAKKSQEDLMKIANFYNSLLIAWCLEDPYAKNGKNIIHTKQEISKFLTHLKIANPDIARRLGKLTAACYHLSYSLYSDINPQICYENFGPYDVSDVFGKGHIMTIKQFHELKPRRLLGDKVNDIPCKKIRVYCVYKDVNFTLDALSHAIYDGDTINGLKYYALDIDGALVKNLNKVDFLSEKIAGESVKLWDELTSLDFENSKIRYLFQRCYNYVYLCDEIGIDWKPSNDMLKAVKNRNLVNNFWSKFKDQQKKLDFLRVLIDPRIEILPKLNKQKQQK
ncbi:MAG: hypothetical protein KKF65_04820 [Nanoarchaeota archaeon]|nr:hypothetical protein [Nanoarchaeota archaeon]